VQDAKQVAAALDDIALLLSLTRGNGWKARAYERGAEVARSLGEDLGELVEQGALQTVEGVGPSLARQIHQLWNSGSSSLLERLRAEHPPGTAELARVPGMSLRRIRALHEALQISSVSELEEACRAGKVRAVHGFGAKTEQRLLVALAELRAAPGEPRRLLLPHALALAARIEAVVQRAHAAERTLVAGAVRRGIEQVDELELLFVTRTPEHVWQRLSGSPLVLHAERSERRAQLASGLPLRVHCAPPELAGAALVLATGGEQHVHALRERARARQLSWSEDGVRAAGDPRPLSMPDEPALYAALGCAYVPPELREDARALEAAAHGELPRLLEASDLRGAVHCHTEYSDGKDSIEAMACAAHALGMQYITITDHSPSAHYAGGVTLERLKQQWDEIAQVQERVPIRILRGAESDILGDGSLDYPDAVLEQLDVVIASIHGRLRMTREQMTARLVQAMRQPFYKIWGHALGRLLSHRDAIDCDVPAVLDALAESRGAIEINADPHRLDLPPQWIPSARERGIPFVVSVDAHSTRGLEVFPLGVTMARRGALTRAEVLNTLDADSFAARVRPR
jgi:DNA polymerase (family X)